LGHPCKFQRFRVLTALLHGTPVVGVSQTLRRWTEGATYIRQGDHHVGHWPTFLVSVDFGSKYAVKYRAALSRISYHRKNITLTYCDVSSKY